jgi:AcrR family transcriptional regulator
MLTSSQVVSSKVKDTRLTQAERTEISDMKMFDTAVSLINERGPAATNLSDVGVLAGYSRGLASHRFGSKDNLFNFVVLKVGDIWLEQLKGATGDYAGFQALERAVDQHYQICVNAPAHLRAFYTLWFESVNAKSQLSDTIQKIHQRRFQDVVNWVLNDGRTPDSQKRDADIIAAQFSASVIGIVYYWLANPEKIKETKRLHDGLKHTMKRLLT